MVLLLLAVAFTSGFAQIANFVVVGPTPGTLKNVYSGIAYSFDGRSWNFTKAGSLQDAFDAFYADGKGYYACGGASGASAASNQANTASSKDGVTWSLGQRGPLFAGTVTCGIAHDGNSTWVLVGRPDCSTDGILFGRCNSVAFSRDGMNFVGLGTGIFDYVGNAASFSNTVSGGIFVIAGGAFNDQTVPTNGNVVASSKNGVDWNIASVPWLKTGRVVVYSVAQKMWVVGGIPVSSCGPTCYGLAISLDNGITWAPGPSQPQAPFKGSEYASRVVLGMAIAQRRGNMEDWIACGGGSASVSALISSTSSGPSNGWTEFSKSDVYNIFPVSSVSYSPFLDQFIVTSSKSQPTNDTVHLIYSYSNLTLLSWKTVNLASVFTKGIYSSAARTESPLQEAPSSFSLSSSGNFLVDVNTTVSQTLTVDGTLRVEGLLDVVPNATLCFLNGSIYVAGTLALSSGSSVSLPNGIALIGSNATLSLRLAPLMLTSASQITIPVLTFQDGSAELQTFSRIGVSGVGCYDISNPQQVVTSSSLSVVVTVTPVPGCSSSTIPASGSAYTGLSASVIVGISIACVVLAVLMVFGIVLLTHWSSKKRTERMSAKLREEAHLSVLQKKL